MWAVVVSSVVNDLPRNSFTLNRPGHNHRLYYARSSGFEKQMKRDNNFVLRDIGGRPVLVPLSTYVINANGLMFLNETGRYVWELLATERSLGDLAEAVAQRFAVDFERAKSDIQSFFNQISAHYSNSSEPLSTTSYGPIVRTLHQTAAMRRQPINGTFELTSRCNLSCGMCYVRHSVTDRSACAHEKPAKFWVELAKDAAENGMVFLLLTGGEVFIRSDFFDIYEPLTRMGLVLTLYTNGTLISKEISDRLAHFPPSSTQITLYGATATTYESVTKVPGSFA